MAQIRHAHNLNHQTSPACEMLRALSLAGFGVVLLPRETGFRPFVVDGLDEVESETRV